VLLSGFSYWSFVEDYVLLCYSGLDACINLEKVIRIDITSRIKEILIGV
jgi:hypothetical protein